MKGFKWSLFTFVLIASLFSACSTTSSSSSDNPEDTPSSDSKPGSSGGKNGTSSSSYKAESVTDADLVDVEKFAGQKEDTVYAKDGIVYNTLRVGPAIWMNENLRSEEPFEAKSACYEYDEINCSKYGRLYLYNKESNPVAACPEDYTLPSIGLWKELYESDVGFEPVFAGACNKRDTLECDGLKSTVRYLANDDRAIVFDKDSAGRISYKVLDAVDNGFYSIRCVKPRTIVEKMVELPICDNDLVNMPNIYVIEKERSYHCDTYDQQWDETTSGVCLASEENDFYLMNGGLLVCRNQKWQVATIRDAGEKCTKAELYNEYVLNSTRYVCLDSGWVELKFPASVLGYCREKFYGKVAKTDEDVSYTCDSTGWRKTVVEDVYGECEEDKVYKTYEYDGRKWLCDSTLSWRVANEHEQAMGFCVPSLFDSVRTYNGLFHKCNSVFRYWETVKAVDYLKTCDESTMWDTVQVDSTVYMCNGNQEWQILFNGLAYGLCTDKNLGETKYDEDTKKYYMCGQYSGLSLDNTRNIVTWSWELTIPAGVELGLCAYDTTYYAPLDGSCYLCSRSFWQSTTLSLDECVN